jgi:putative ABC transport system ATP-binding protein
LTAPVDSRASNVTADPEHLSTSAPAGPVDRRPAIRIEGLFHHFGQGEQRFRVLDDIDLEVGTGEIVIVTGPSGSGKTTLLTLIGALRQAQEGSLRVLGRELVGLAPRALVDVRRQLGFIFQAHNLFDSLTALQNVRLALDLHSEIEDPDERARQALAAVGLEDRLHSKPAALSGGQRQRVAVARALAGRPLLILADEPTAALDRDSGRRVVEVLQELARTQGSSTLLVTHDNRILDVADRIVNLVDGRIASNVLVSRSVEICQFLAENDVFKGLTPGALAEVAEQMQTESFAAGDVVFRQGDPGDKLYLIRSGSVEVIDESGAGRRVLATRRGGEIFGELALLSDKPRNATIVVAEDAVLYTLERGYFEEAIARSKSLRDQLLDLLVVRTS